MRADYDLEKFVAASCSNIEGYPLTLPDVIVRDNMLEEAVKRLPARQAKIVRRVILSNWSKARVARHLRVSRPRINQILKQAFKNIKRILLEIPIINK